MNIDHLNSMDGYTFDEGIAFLVLIKAPRGVINHIKATHNRNHLHSEIHKQLRFPRVREIVRRSEMEFTGNVPQISQNFPVEETVQTDEQETETPEIEQKSDEIEQKSDEIEQKQDETERQSPAPDGDDSGLILTKEDVHTHENTRLEDMPNDLCRTLWLKRQEVYREMQQAHLKMRSVPEGEEYNEERAKWRDEVLRLDAENDGYWKQIDAEIERIKAGDERADKKADKKAFDESSCRAFIGKAIRKKQLKPAQFAELQQHVDALLQANGKLEDDIIEKLIAIGIKVG